MILSETVSRHKRPLPIAALETLQQISVATKCICKGYYSNKLSKLIAKILTAKLCQFKASLIVIFLLIFQFSLYDFNGTEYMSTNYHTIASG